MAPKIIFPFPIVLRSLDTVHIRFGVTTFDNIDANQKVSSILIDGISHAVEIANAHLSDSVKIKSLYIVATTNGNHGPKSNHYIGAAADISRINDQKMALTGVSGKIMGLRTGFNDFHLKKNFGTGLQA